jgi:hypothetical protein
VDLAKIPSRPRKAIEAFVFMEIPKLDSLGASGKIESMKGIDHATKQGLDPTELE